MKAVEAARAMASECLCFRSRRMARLITRAYDEALRPIGLEATQLTLMSAIALGGSDGNRMRSLADVLAMDMSTLSRNLKPLERMGAIEILRQPEDRRVRIAHLTPAGEKLLKAALPMWRNATDRVSAILGEGAAADLRVGLDSAAKLLGEL